nr:hypothetical protein [bacterium]
HSVIDQSATPSALADGYGAYDEYLAPNGDRYTYQTGTNMLTGYSVHRVAGSSSPTLTQDQAIQAMSAYLEQFLGADHPYVFSKVEQDNGGSWYGVYRYLLDGQPTDDMAIIAIDSTGQLESFSTHRRGRYEKYQGISIDIQPLESQAIAQRDAYGWQEYDLLQAHITKNDAGQLVWSHQYWHWNTDTPWLVDQTYIQIPIQ